MVQFVKTALGLGLGLSLMSTASFAAVQEGDTGALRFTPDFFASTQPVTALDMVSRLPGFSLNSGAGNDVRGYAQAAGNVLINGQRPASKSEGLDRILSRIAADEVERIDLIRGSAPGIDMQGKSVVANVITKANRSERISGNLMLESRIYEDGQFRPQLQLEAQGKLKEVKWQASFKAQTNRNDDDGKGTDKIFDAAKTLTRKTDYAQVSRFLAPILRVGVEAPLMGGTLYWSGMFDPEIFKSRLKNAIPNAPDQTRVNVHTDKSENSLRYEKKLTEKLDLEAVALNTQSSAFEHTYFGTRASNLYKDHVFSTELITKGALKWHPNAQLDLVVDAERALNQVKNSDSVNDFVTPISGSYIRVREDRKEVGLLGKWRPITGLSLEGGVRYETSDVTTSDPLAPKRTLGFTKPKIVIAYSLTPNDQLRLTVERRVSQLNLFDFTPQRAFDTGAVFAGNTAIRPDQRWSYALDGEHRFGEKGVLAATVYFDDITDALDRRQIITKDGTFDGRANIGPATDKGLKLSATLPLDAVQMPLAQISLGTNWSETEVTDPTTGQKRRLSGNSAIWGQNIIFKQDLPQWRAKWGFNAFLGQKSRVWRATEVRANEGGDWLEIYYEFRPTKQWVIHLEADNLLLRDRKFDRTFYSGQRPASISGFQSREVTFPRYIYLSARRNF